MIKIPNSKCIAKSNAHHLISPKKTQKEWSQNDSSCAPLGSTFHCAKGNIKVHMYVLSSQFQGCWISRIYYLCWLWLHLQNQKWCYTQINEEHGLSTASKNHIKFSKSFIGYTEISLMAELGGYMAWVFCWGFHWWISVQLWITLLIISIVMPNVAENKWLLHYLST